MLKKIFKHFSTSSNLKNISSIPDLKTFLNQQRDQFESNILDSGKDTETCK